MLEDDYFVLFACQWEKENNNTLIGALIGIKGIEYVNWINSKTFDEQ